jgi:outer membrane cobalamin receptor
VVARQIILFLFLAAGILIPATGQGITDSIFAIGEVAVKHTDDFNKEQAGMKKTTVDTVILQHQVHTDLSTLLAENTNIYIRDYGRGALATASFRGTAPSHTQVTWNGLNINSPMLGMVDLSLVPVFIIDKLNIHHGAASVTSRSGGLGGHVEIRSLPDWSNRTGGKVYTDYGSFGTAGGMAQLDLGSSKFQSKTRLYSSGSENDYPFVNKNIIEKDSATGALFHPIQQNRNAAYQKSGISQEFYFRPAKRSSRRRTSYSHSNRPGQSIRPEQSLSSAASSSEHTSSNSGSVPATGPSADPLPPGRTVLSNRTWLQTADRSVPTVLSSEYEAGGLQRDNEQGDRTVKNVTEYNFYGELTKVQLRSGIDYQRLDYSMETEVVGLHRQKNVDSESRMLSWYNSGSVRHNFSERLSADAQASFNRYGIATFDSATRTGYDTVRLETSLFGGLYFSAMEQLQLSVQLRQDFVSDHTSPLIYTFGVNYRPLENHDLVVRGNFARNYHHPTLNDMYWQPGGNPDLRPEEGHTGEVTVLWETASGERSAGTSLTGYYSRISDWILWLPGFKGYWEPVNLAEVRSYGLEYQLSAELEAGRTKLRLHGNVALSHTRDYSGVPGDRDVDSGEPDGEQLPFIPKFSGNAFFSVMNRGWYLTWQYNAMGTRQLMSSGSGGPADDSNELLTTSGTDRLYSLYPWFMNDLRIGKRFAVGSGKMESGKNDNRIPLQMMIVELRIDNLFNETYRNELQRFMPGRSYTLHLKFDF